MTKKISLIFACIFISMFVKAQIASYQYPAGDLTEEKIIQLIYNSSKKGVQEWEIKKLNLILHNKLKEQSNNKTIAAPLQINSDACVNAGFENGTNSNWSFYNGNVASASLPCNSCANLPGGIANVVNNTSTLTGQYTSGNDFYGNFPVVAPAPFGGNYSLVLNDANSGSKIERATYSFLVDTSINIFTFQYAAVLQTGGHLPNEQPYFHVDVTDNTTGSTIPCSQYDASAPSSGALSGWSISSLDNTVYFKTWESINIDLQSVVGHSVTVNFIVSDCIYGGHFGYCYIDAACGSINLVNNINFQGLCDTTGMVTINAPAGYFNYQWYGPNNNTAISGDTTQSITVNANLKDTFVVNCNSAIGCPISLKYIINPAAISIYSPTDTINAGDTITLSAMGAINYTWTSSDGGSYTGDSISIFPLSNTTYTVTGADSSGCTAATEKIIYVVQSTAGIKQKNIDNQISVYPNPASNSLNIECKLKSAFLFITDVLGNKIKQITIQNGLTSLDISALSKGVYFLNIENATSITTKKFVVQR